MQKDEVDSFMGAIQSSSAKKDQMSLVCRNGPGVFRRGFESSNNSSSIKGKAMLEDGLLS